MRVTELFTPTAAPTNGRYNRPKWTLAAIACLVLAPAAARAGGGPENVLLVVNANSAGSKAVANHYIRSRDLPASNVVYLDYNGPLERVSGERFREEIFLPAAKAIDDRGLGLQIDMVAYSTDFPWLVNLQKEYPKEVKLTKQQSPYASLTGATYLYTFVLGKHPGVVTLATNWYVPSPKGRSSQRNLLSCASLSRIPSRAFRSRYAWLEGGRRSPDVKKGRRYLMSTMLGVTTGRGSTVEEVIASLDRAVEAERSPPEGTFCFVRNNSARSTPRHACFAAAAEELKRLGAKVQVQTGDAPKQVDQLLGTMLGTREIDFDRAGFRISPGAICEQLTSYGGVLTTKPGYQTPLTDWIRAGATGSCGTVAEPYAIQAKFPLPSLHVHYRRGCSLAESFYQSVAAPYQLLIVGDPLCQPWAQRPNLTVDGWPTPANGGDLSTLGLAELGLAELGLAELGIKPPATETADSEPEGGSEETEPEGPPPVLKIVPRVTTASGKGASRWELFVDGKLRMRLPTGQGAAFTAEQLGPGWHDLRCVGFSPDALESQRRQLGGIEVLEIEGQTFAPVRLRRTDKPLRVAATAEGAERISIRQGMREVAVIEGPGGETDLSAEVLGPGPVRLRAVAEPSGAASPPLWLRARGSDDGGA
ncbi:hypothetical protein MalM25_00570 [Planctomycetes bacterium MalM25]|nr:hypothetical protein MalM25_00570 [Planctomycetes bacterium MalM25]